MLLFGRWACHKADMSVPVCSINIGETSSLSAFQASTAFRVFGSTSHTLYNPPIKKYKVSNQKVQKRDVFFAPRFLYPFHTSKGGIFAPFDRLLYFLEGRRVDQIEHDDLIAACLHCGTAAAEGGNRIAQRLTLEGIM